MNRNISNCPFCGSNKVKIRKKNRTVIGGTEKRNTYCYCTICDSRGGRVLYESFEHQFEAEEKAVELWNRRYEQM